MSKKSYPDLIINAFKTVQAWRTATFVLVGLLIFETIALLWLAANRTVILIPQGLSNAKAPITLNLGEPFTPDYLTSVAKGDIYALLNWTPDNIDTQYGLFMSRLTPTMHDAQKAILLNEAKLHKEEGLTQSFYHTRTFVKGDAVIMHGILVRSSGGREIFRGPAIYQFNYVNSGSGLLLISSVTQPTGTSSAQSTPQPQPQNGAAPAN